MGGQRDRGTVQILVLQNPKENFIIIYYIYIYNI